jgi:Rieske Fe-S protein
MLENHSASRRRVLEMFAAAALCNACSGASGADPEPIGDVSAGNVSDLPVGSLRAVGSVAACIGRDSSGVYAMTLTCTHAGCNMAVSGSVSSVGAACACHGSLFDANGAVTRGPAQNPLQHFAVSVDTMGNLTIHGGTRVDATVRLMV